jgi:hypothetical protein
VIGFVIGRLTVGKGEPSGPLKRLSEVETGPARATEDAGQAADLRRRLGVAYQTIRELEESNMLLREVAESADSEPEGGATEGAAPEGDEATAAPDQPDADDETPMPKATEPTVGDQPNVEPEARKAGGPAELIRAAKAAKQNQAGSSSSESTPSAGPASDAGAESDTPSG